MPKRNPEKASPQRAATLGEAKLAPRSNSPMKGKATARLLRVRSWTAQPVSEQPESPAKTTTVVRSGVKVDAKKSKEVDSLQDSSIFKNFRRDIEALAAEAAARAAKTTRPPRSALLQLSADGLRDCLRTLAAIPAVEKDRQNAQAILIVVRTAAFAYAGVGDARLSEGPHLIVQAARHLGRAEELLSGLDERRRVAKMPKVRPELQGLRDAIAKNPDASTRELATEFKKDERTVRRLKQDFRNRSTGQN